MTSLREAVDYEAAAKALINLAKTADLYPTHSDNWRKRADVIVDAALAPLIAILDASEEVSWCEVHRSDGVPRLGREASTCWKAEFTKHLDAHDCNIVSSRLIPSSLLAGLGET